MPTKRRNLGSIHPANAAFHRPHIEKLSLKELDGVLTRIANTFSIKLQLNHQPICGLQFSGDDLYEAAYDFAIADTHLAKRQALTALSRMGFRTSRVVEQPKPSQSSEKSKVARYENDPSKYKRLSERFGLLSGPAREKALKRIEDDLGISLKTGGPQTRKYGNLKVGTLTELASNFVTARNPFERTLAVRELSQYGFRVSRPTQKN